MSQLDTPARSKVVKHMQRLVVQHRVGERLPSVRKISEACQVSPLTVQAVVEDFCRRGLVEAKARKGLFVSSENPAQEMIQQIDVVYLTGDVKSLEPGHTDQGAMFQPQLLHELAKQCGRQMRGTRVHVLSLQARDAEIEELVSRADFQSCIVIGAQDDRVQLVMQQHEVPYVHLFPAGPILPKYSIALDNQAIVRTQVDHLIQLGHRKIGVLSRMDPAVYHRDQSSRRELFYRMMAEGGLQIQPHWVQQMGYGAEDVSDAVRAVMADVAHRPTALIVADNALPMIYQTLHTLGIRPGTDIAIVGTDGLPISQALHPLVTSLHINREKAAEMALRKLQQRTYGQPTSELDYVPFELIVRQTSCQPLERKD